MPKNKTLPLQIYNFFLYFSPIGQFFTNILFWKYQEKHRKIFHIYLFHISYQQEKHLITNEIT